MRVAGIIRDSLVNGEGIRDVVFVQGCPHRCFQCQNQHTWDYNGGKEVNPYELAKGFKDSPNDITISGGEPFSQWEAVVSFMYYIRLDNPNKRFWVYTGFQYEDVKWVVENLKRENTKLSDATINRRASTIRSWVEWMYTIDKENTTI